MPDRENMTMAETEIESILREIRERVIAQQPAAHLAAPSSSAEISNGAFGEGAAPARLEAHNISAERLTVINSYLTTTARAWDRLPPLVSNRSGFPARLELWMKRRLRAATRWFTWEQINFNSSVHHALSDLLPVLSAHAAETARLRVLIEAAAENHAKSIQQLSGEIEACRLTIEALRSSTEAHCFAGDSNVMALAAELRQRLDHVQAEQRVSFKQLVLETSEAAVMDDRARRKTEVLCAELQRRIEQLEKGKGG